LIDDAREFICRGDYPTIEQLKVYLKEKSIDFDFEVKSDIIRIVMRRTATK
jgi:hypothetical protein